MKEIDYIVLCGLLDSIEMLRDGIVLEAGSYGFTEKLFYSFDEAICRIYDDHHLPETKLTALACGMNGQSSRLLDAFHVNLEELLAKLETNNATRDDWQIVYETANKTIESAKEWRIAHCTDP